MSNQYDFNDEALREKLNILLDEENEIKKWNEGIMVKILVLLPTILFVVGLVIVNRPENFLDLLFIFLYPLALILMGLIILFFMTSKLK
tara:strand:+ start:281 stop:547 length:267 start_codon:yes stop_codon:yes gene_type:complete